MQTFTTPVIFTQLASLLDCLRDAMRSLPEPCSITIQPGLQPAFDFGIDGCHGGNGKAWVRLVTQFPSARFPQPLTTSSNCDAWMWAYQIEVGIMRSVDVGDGTMPISDEQNMEDALLQIADSAAMHRAILCCFGDGDAEIILGQYQPYGPQGGVVGGTYILTVRL